MKKYFFLFLIACFFLSQKTEAIDFKKLSLVEAFELANRENKPVFLYFTAKWCGPCRYMQNYIFTDQYIHTYANENYISILFDVDSEEGKQAFQKFFTSEGVSVPKFLIVSSNNEIVKRHAGSMKLNHFKDFLEVDKKEIVIETEKNNQQSPRFHDKFFYNAMNSRWRPGLKIGVNSNTLVSSSSASLLNGLQAAYSHSVGLNAGLYFERRTRNWAIQPGIGFSRRNVSEDQLGVISFNALEFPTHIQCKIFDFKKSIPESFLIFVAPYTAYFMGSNRFKTEDTDTANRWDAGMKAGVVILSGTFELVIGYERGFVNIGNGSGIEAFNSGFFINFGFVVGR
ncbi:MAG: outer membrane beta-barrel protein [Cyclobacteriaceae bacterium]|nr:outer membrane beta-barrel protein [Cyclobacteriaceae bacterium]